MQSDSCRNTERGALSVENFKTLVKPSRSWPAFDFHHALAILKKLVIQYFSLNNLIGPNLDQLWLPLSLILYT